LIEYQRLTEGGRPLLLKLDDPDPLLEVVQQLTNKELLDGYNYEWGPMKDAIIKEMANRARLGRL